MFKLTHHAYTDDVIITEHTLSEYSKFIRYQVKISYLSLVIL